MAIPSPANTLPESPWGFPHDVLFIPPQLSAGSFVYTRLPRALLNFVDPPPLSGVLAPYSDRYKKDGKPDQVRRNINRAQTAAFHGAAIPLALPPVPPAPVQTSTATPAQTKAPPPPTCPLCFLLRMAFPLPRWRTTWVSIASFRKRNPELN